MFEDCILNTVSFIPPAKQNGGTSNYESQTTLCTSQDKSEQCTYRSSQMVQTEETEHNEKFTYNEERLAEFLKLKYPLIQIFLDEINRPTPKFGNIDENNAFSHKNKKIYEIKSPLEENSFFIEQVRVSASAWKKGSSLVCFGYSFKHENWCSHRSLFQFDALQETHEKTLHDIIQDGNLIPLMTLQCNNPHITPTKEFVTSSCITGLAYHPHIPTVLAGAMFNGQIIIWDLNKEDAVVTTIACHKPENGHKDAVSQISWIRNFDIRKNQPLLVTSGSDGLIILWHFNQFAADLTIFAKLTTKPPPEIYNKGSKYLKYTLFDVDVGVTCFSFSVYDPLTFIVGLETGDILKCYITEKSIKEANKRTHILETYPVVGQYESHSASITDIIHLKHLSGHADKFVTSGVDKIIKIFDERQDVPVRIFHCEEVILGLTFCIAEEEVLIAWGNHRIYFYDIHMQERIKTWILSDLPQRETTSVSSSRKSIIAMGSSEGIVSIWKISGILTKE